MTTCDTLKNSNDKKKMIVLPTFKKNDNKKDDYEPIILN